MASENTDWLCPMCSKERMKYGTNCPLYDEGTCQHQDELNATGQWYTRQKTYDEDELAKTIGIGAISDD